MINNTNPGPNHSKKNSTSTGDQDNRTDDNRRKRWGLLSFYLAGGIEQRHQSDRRHQKNTSPFMDSMPENRIHHDRRKVIDTKYLNCGKCIDIRKGKRRSNERIHREVVERIKYDRLGPGWL